MKEVRSGGPARTSAVAQAEAGLLAIVAIVCRLCDQPKAAALGAYASAGCSWLAARRARQHEHAGTRAD